MDDSIGTLATVSFKQFTVAATEIPHPVIPSGLLILGPIRHVLHSSIAGKQLIIVPHPANTLALQRGTQAAHCKEVNESLNMQDSI